ncbi:hypothetical protein FO519_008684 [Halicephalobus sp. NKZ332]|nr:hypothetical protein FO519_008684 [Halicephalobus sp. NKZ332]
MISWLKKKRSQVGTKVKAIAEAVVLRAVIFGLLCDFLPHVSDTIFIQITGDTPFRYIGPYSRVIMAIDLLLNSIMNRLLFMKIRKKIIAVQVSAIKTSVTAIFHDWKLPEDCVAYGCVLFNNAQLTYTYTRTVGAIMSTTVGILFIVITLWLRKKQPQIATKVKVIAEAVIFRAVIFGILCDFIPHVSDTILISTTGNTLFKYIGPYSRVVTAADILLSSIMNWLVFIRAKKKSITLIQTVTTVTAITRMNFLTSVLFHRSEKPEGCVAYGCILYPSAQLTYTYTRTAGAISNAAVGISFIIITLWLRKRKVEIATKVKIIAEAVVLRAVIFGLICDFVPHVSDTILISTTGSSLFEYIGPYTFMLTLDKCLIFLLKEKYNQQCAIVLFRVSVLINIIVIVANFLISILFHESKLPEGCGTYGCILFDNAQLMYMYTRAVGAILSTAAGILFIFVTSWLKKKKLEVVTKVKAIAEAVVFRAVIFEIFCDFIPHVLDIILISTTGNTLFMYIGPYSSFMMAADLVLSSIMNWLVFMKAKKNNNIILVKNVTTITAVTGSR